MHVFAILHPFKNLSFKSLISVVGIDKAIIFLNFLLMEIYQVQLLLLSGFYEAVRFELKGF